MLCLLRIPSLDKKLCQNMPELVADRLYYEAPEKHFSDSFTERRGDEILIVEGIVANGKRLLDAYAVKDLKELFWQAMRDNSILGKLHGQFFAVCYNAVSGEFHIFTNPGGNLRLYYYHQNDTLIVSDKIKTIVDILADIGIPCSVDGFGARMILSYSYMLEGFTTINDIKQLPSASRLSYRAGILEETRYFKWNYEIRHQATHQSFRELSQLFKTAVSDAFLRDEDRPHIAFLSGGLDSRFVVYTAHKLGYRDFSVLNFSEPGYLDATIAAKIAKELNLKLHFSSLEGGEYLYDIDQNLEYQEGQTVLYGAAHLFHALQGMPLKRYGILHSGQVGDIIKGTHLHERAHSPVDLERAAYSSRILQRFSGELDFVRDRYPNHEAFVLYNWCLNAETNGDLAAYQFSHSLSPFVAPDFMQYVLNIDPAARYGGRVNMDWMKYSFPRAARHVWERTGARVSDPFWLVQLKYYAWRGSHKLARKISKQPNRLSMVPFEYWWQTNDELRAHLNSAFSCLEQAQPFLDKELQADMNILFHSNLLSEKLQAYTLARGILYLLGKEEKVEVKHD